MDSILHRLKRKSLSNQIAIAVGSYLSDPKCSIPSLSKELIQSLKLDVRVNSEEEYFRVWNDVVEKAEKKIEREKVKAFIAERTHGADARPLHHKIASLPISNFIDATFDRSLYKAVVAQGKTPILHDWESQTMGSWRQSDYRNPNIFFLFPSPASNNPWFGLYQLILKLEQNKIQLLNMCEMLNSKDLILLNFGYFEAEFVLMLSSLVTCCEKIVNCFGTLESLDYWAACGVSLVDIPCEELINKLLPYGGKEKYTGSDVFGPRGLLVESNREKQYDTFISYFTGDEAFANMLYQELSIRGLHICG